jgi:hypothetical protein
MIDPIAKVLIIEKNCAQLIALTVWLTQFPQLQVHGSMSEKNLKKSDERNLITNYDLIIYGLEIDNNEEFPLELAMALSLIRKLKSTQNSPAIILLANHLSSKPTSNINRQINQQLLKESDGQLYLTNSLIDFHKEINRLLSYRKVIDIVTAKAG